jgi:hypothetical protein
MVATWFLQEVIVSLLGHRSDKELSWSQLCRVDCSKSLSYEKGCKRCLLTIAVAENQFKRCRQAQRGLFVI